MSSLKFIKPCKNKRLETRTRTSESYNDYQTRIRTTFLNNIFRNKYFFRNKLVKFNLYKNPQGEVESFYHAITKEISHCGSSTRVPDLQRYNMCLYVFVLLDSLVCNSVSCTCHTAKPDPSNPKRISVFCSDIKYVVILEPHTNHYLFITAFPVSEDNIDKYS